MNDDEVVYLSKLQSLRRGVREGWYVVDNSGSLQSGPFATREALAMRVTAPAR